jgi:4-diphosphocytidyl-2-C-methyl-D-erythritol kinase
LSPGIKYLRGLFGTMNCMGHQMSGSGTSYFGICRNARHARRVAGRLRSAGVGFVFCGSTCSAPPCC